MKRIDAVHRGHVTAAGFIIDVPTIGEQEARERALAILEPTDRLLALPDGRWLLVADAPVGVDSASAPGLALTRHGEALVAVPGLDRSYDITELRFGTLTCHTAATLPVVDRTDWFDLGAVLTLRPLEAPSTPKPAGVETPPAPDLRARAGIAAAPSGTTETLRELQALARGLSAPADGPGRRAPRRGSSGKFHRRRQRRDDRTGSAAPAPQRIRTAIAARVMRSPAAGFVGRKHARYIEELTRQFQSGQLDEALRRAIPVGGEHAVALSLKLPQRRSDLRISAGERAATSVPYGPTIQQHLTVIYRQAATDLESQGRIDEAAFVLAELLQDAHGCIALLERHRQFDEAARIAEQRQLDPGTIVRLWWLAKDRRRAIAVARRHGAFAAALVRLDKVDPQAANELRVEWMADLERRGDLLGAVEVAWPTPSLHALLINILARGERLGGPSGGALRAYALALSATDRRVTALLDLVRQADDPTGELVGFASTFAKVAAATPPVDRRVATAFLRAHPVEVPGAGTRSNWWWKIRGRADATLVADLPAGGRFQDGQQRALALPRLPPGQLTISDAAGLPNGEVLVALGALGCRLLGRNGPIIGEWHVPTSHLVIADHGGSALLLDQRPDGEVDVRHLDLTNRRLRHYGTMHLASFSDSFDGAQWLVVDRTNAAVVDVTESSPTIVWRPLETGTTCHSLLRTPTEVTALVIVRRDSIGGHDNELRTWNPTMARLTNRRIAHFPPEVSAYQLLPEGFLTRRGAYAEISRPDRIDRLELAGNETVAAEGDLLVRTVSTADGRALRIERWPDRTEVIKHALTDGEVAPAVRSHGALLTVWDRAGPVHAIDIERMAIMTSVRTSP